MRTFKVDANKLSIEHSQELIDFLEKSNNVEPIVIVNGKIMHPKTMIDVIESE